MSSWFVKLLTTANMTKLHFRPLVLLVNLVILLYWLLRIIVFYAKQYYFKFTTPLWLPDNSDVEVLKRDPRYNPNNY